MHLFFDLYITPASLVSDLLRDLIGSARREQRRFDMDSRVLLYFIVYLIVVNVLAFILYGMDKSRARSGQWRISEKTLIGIAVIGGSVGAIIGMYAFRHKTRHWYFRYGLPVILILQVAALLYLRGKGIL